MTRHLQIILAFSICAPFLLPGIAFSQGGTENPTIMVHSPGVEPCSDYRPAYQAAINRDDWRGMSAYLPYFSGLITGLNVAGYPSSNTSGTNDLLGAVDVKGFAGAVDKYCADNPMGNVFQGIMDAVSTLSGRPGQR